MTECNFHLPTKVARTIRTSMPASIMRKQPALCSPRISAPGKLQMGTHCLSRARFVGADRARYRAPPLGSAVQVPRAARRALVPASASDFELRWGSILRAQHARQSDWDRRGRPANRGFLVARRLVGARYPALGDVSAGSFPQQKLRDLGFALGRNRRCLLLSEHRRCPGRRVIRVRSNTCLIRLIRRPAGWTFISK